MKAIVCNNLPLIPIKTSASIYDNMCTWRDSNVEISLMPCIKDMQSVDGLYLSNQNLPIFTDKYKYYNDNIHIEPMCFWNAYLCNHQHEPFFPGYLLI